MAPCICEYVLNWLVTEAWEKYNKVWIWLCHPNRSGLVGTSVISHRLRFAIKWRALTQWDSPTLEFSDTMITDLEFISIAHEGVELKGLKASAQRESKAHKWRRQVERVNPAFLHCLTPWPFICPGLRMPHLTRWMATQVAIRCLTLVSLES